MTSTISRFSRSKGLLAKLVLGAAISLGGSGALGGCGGGTRTIQEQVDVDPGNPDGGPTRPVDPAPSRLPYVRADELGFSGNPYPLDTRIATGGYFSRSFTNGGQVIYDFNGDGLLKLEPFLSTDPTINVRIKNLFNQPASAAYVQESLDFGYTVTLSGTYDTKFDVDTIENWGDPLDTINYPNLENLIGTAPQPSASPYVRPAGP